MACLDALSDPNRKEAIKCLQVFISIKPKTSTKLLNDAMSFLRWMDRARIKTLCKTGFEMVRSKINETLIEVVSSGR